MVCFVFHSHRIQYNIFHHATVSISILIYGFQNKIINVILYICRYFAPVPKKNPTTVSKLVDRLPQDAEVCSAGTSRPQVLPDAAVLPNRAPQDEDEEFSGAAGCSQMSIIANRQLERPSQDDEQCSDVVEIPE